MSRFTTTGRTPGARSLQPVPGWVAKSTSPEGIPEDILRTLPLQLCITSTVDQAAEFLPSQGEGHPQTARHIRTPQELHKLSRTVNSAWRSVKFRSMPFDPLLARVNTFSVVPESEKEQIRSMSMSHVLAVDMAARQLNLFGALVAQVNLRMGAGDPQDGSAPFSRRTAAPEAWALLEATMAAIAHPPQQLSVLLTNRIAAAYASAGDPSIKLFVEDDSLKIAPPIVEADLINKRKAEGDLQAAMNPNKRAKDTAFSGRRPSRTGRRARGSRPGLSPARRRRLP